MSEPQTLASGRYMLVQRLGEGGMATVYRAFDKRLQVWRAVKVLLPEYARKRKIVKRFEVEAQMMALLEHTNIVRVYDVDHDGGYAYIVMELVEGGCLVDWLEAHGPMPPRMALDVTVSVCQAIDFANSKKVVHRDIKPHNVMVDRAGVCKVTDFGIAQASEENRSLTKTGAVMGTWGYMAPEQRTDAKHVDQRADVYAIAATLYSLITDTTPMDLFAADRDTSMLDAIPEPLRPALLKATDYHKENRYDSAADFAAALLEVRDALPEIPRGTPSLVIDGASSMEVPTGAYDPTGHNEPPAAPRGTLMPADDADPDAREAIHGGTSVDEVGRYRPPGTQPESTLQRRFPAWTVAVALLFGFAGAGIGGVAISGMMAEDPPPEAPTPVARTVEPPVVVPAEPAITPAPEAPATAAAVEPAPQPVAVAPTPKATPRPAAVRAATPVPVATPRPTPKPAPAAVVPAPTPRPTAVAAVEPEPEPVAVGQRFERVSAPTSAALGDSVAFAARMAAKGEVTLYYRAAGGGPWYQKRMSFVMGQYRISIPMDDSYAKGMEWYMSAGGLTWGTPSRPKVLAVR